MSLSDQFNSCMRSHGMPAPVDLFEGVKEFLDFLHQLHAAAEAAGIDVNVMTVAEAIAALEASGAIAAGTGEALLAALGVAAGAAIEIYEIQCLRCLASTAIDSLRVYASNETDGWLTTAMNQQGIDITDTAVA